MCANRIVITRWKFMVSLNPALSFSSFSIVLFFFFSTRINLMCLEWVSYRLQCGFSQWKIHFSTINAVNWWIDRINYKSEQEKSVSLVFFFFLLLMCKDTLILYHTIWSWNAVNDLRRKTLRQLFVFDRSCYHGTFKRRMPIHNVNSFAFVDKENSKNVSEKKNRIEWKMCNSFRKWWVVSQWLLLLLLLPQTSIWIQWRKWTIIDNRQQTLAIFSFSLILSLSLCVHFSSGNGEKKKFILQVTRKWNALH